MDPHYFGKPDPDPLEGEKEARFGHGSELK